MTIYLISRGYPGKRDPQWGSFEKEQAEALVAIGHKVVMLSVDSRFRKYWRTIGVTKVNYNGVVAFNIFLCPGVIIRFFFGRRITQRFKEWQLWLLFKKARATYGKPDILYSHYLPNSERALFIKEKTGIPLVGIEHWSKVGKNDILPSVRKQAEKTYKRLDGIITVSTSLKSIIKEQFGVDSHVVHNMLGKGFMLCDKEIHSNDDIVSFISVGNLLPIKGYDLLIKAFSRIKHNNTKWTLKIIGEGTARDELEDLVLNHELQGNIFLAGLQSKDEIILSLQNSDVYVVSSHSETFCVAAIEALACGLPVLATDCGGPRDYITDENGILCPVNNVEAMTDSIEYMIEHYKKYDRKKISEDCMDRFSPRKIAGQLTNVFEIIMSKQ